MVHRHYVAIHTLIMLMPMLLSGPVLAAGLLGVHPQNPRYFTDGSGQAIYLAGHQSFVDLQDNSFNKDHRYGQPS